MTQEDNIVKLPDPLERRALRIEAAIIRRTKGDAEWIEGTVDLAVELLGARNDFPGNVEFGQWFDSRFTSTGKTTVSHQDRAILVRWGAAPDQLRGGAYE